MALTKSQHPDDALLASWVKEHYLHNMNDQIKGGCQIRTQECFAQLLNAYKRVRTLTNSAQDKWPFFDRRWKSMNQATVRSIAEGEMKLKSSDTTAFDPSSSSAFVPSSTLRQAFPKQSDTATHGTLNLQSYTSVKFNCIRSDSGWVMVIAALWSGKITDEHSKVHL